MGKPTFEMLWARCLAKKPRGSALMVIQARRDVCTVSLLRPDVFNPPRAETMAQFKDDPIRALEKMEHWIDRLSSPSST